MRVRIVDYVANPGGGVRFTVEMLRALRARSPASFEIVSHGEALARYRGLIDGEEQVLFRDIPPARSWKTRTLMAGIPGAGPLNHLLGTGRFHFEVPASALEECDVAWMPWLHRHRIPWELAVKVVASLHDVIAIDFRGIVSERQRRDEQHTVRSWLASPARIAVSSNATVARLRALFGAHDDRFRIIPLSGKHVRPKGPDQPRPWAFAEREYVLSPISLTPHKNAEVLLAGLGASRERHPLVLTGSGTDLWDVRSARKSELVSIAGKAGFRRDESLFALGYVDDSTYYELLDRAWALVMPTLAEGGGSFPVLEALAQGVPVIASDIPVMREMVERAGGRVIWFDPHSPLDLAAKVEELSRDYARIRAHGEAQVRTLRFRSWDDVAADYAGLMRLA